MIISQYYQDDHGRLDRIFDEFLSQLSENPLQARKHFEDFSTGLKRHIRWEEDILFPRFEAKTGMHDTGPTAVMRSEHKQIEAILDTIHEKLQASDTSVVKDAEEVLLILKHHNLKEERMLYPNIDHLLSPSEVKEVAQEMGVTPAAEA